MQVRHTDEGLNSAPFTISVAGLRTVWSLSVRCWVCEGGVRLHNPVVICLNLLQVAATNTSDTAADRDTPPPPAAVSFQFGVFNNNLKHFTMGKLEKVRKCFLGALTILYNGFYF